MKILAINPGSTSTKIAVFKNTKKIFVKEIIHSAKQLQQFKKIVDQYDFRKQLILKELEKAKFHIDDFDAVVGRGGLLKPIKSGIYRVNQLMLEDLTERPVGEHASNLGAVLAKAIAAKTKKPNNAFIVDPVVVDEMDDIARISGIPQVPRKSIFHALNQKAVAKKYAKKLGKKYEELNLIVVHLGGGISIGAHQKGKVIDVSSGYYEGTFTPERSGNVPMLPFLNMCFSKQHSYEDLSKMIIGKGGLVAYLGTNDVRKVNTAIAKGDKYAQLILTAMAYQIAKEIGAIATVLKGNVDAIILTGGIAFDKRFCQWLKTRIKFMAKVVIYPGEQEMEALAQEALEALTGLVPIKKYK